MSRNNIKRSTMCFDDYCASYLINSLGPKSREPKFLRKGYLPGDKRFWPFFRFYRVRQNSGDKFKGSNMYCDNYCGSYRIISVTPKRLLKQKFLEKRQFFQ